MKNAEPTRCYNLTGYVPPPRAIEVVNDFNMSSVSKTQKSHGVTMHAAADQISIVILHVCSDLQLHMG